MTKLLLIGDVHGYWERYAKILEVHNPDRSVQIGDFGIGFRGEDPENLEQVRYAMDNFGAGDNKYIRGNHDNPQSCREDPRWIADATFEEDTGIFYLGGAWSIDHAWRTEGASWWADEELSMDELYAAIDVYEAARPRVVITHECPEDIVGLMFNWYRREYPSRTRNALASMLYIHKPELWVFGHWHTSMDRVIDGTRFVCLNELETMTIDV
jgi:predicted phosphodiesterase